MSAVTATVAAPVEKPAGQCIHTGTLRLPRSEWTALRFACEAAADHYDRLASDCERVHCRDETVAYWRAKAAQARALVETVQTAATMTSRACMALARQSTRDDRC